MPKPEGEGEDTEKEEAKFNMALASLERVNKDLIEFKNLMAYGRVAKDTEVLPLEQRQFISIRLVKQLFLASAPLLVDKKEVLEKLRKEVYALRPKLTYKIKHGEISGERILDTSQFSFLLNHSISISSFLIPS